MSNFPKPRQTALVNPFLKKEFGSTAELHEHHLGSVLQKQKVFVYACTQTQHTKAAKRSKAYQSSEERSTLPDGQYLSTLNTVISASAK